MVIKNYFPIAHGTGPNMDRDRVLRWFKDVCESPAIKIFHNAMYDVSWIRNLGIKINGFNYRYHGCSIID
jgi:hypothetical protein